jgi:hypothetical protein
MTAELQDSSLASRPSVEGLAWTPHPLVDQYPEYRRLDDNEFAAMATAVGMESALEYFKAREQRIADSQSDPFRHEFPLPHWADVEAMVKRKTVTFVPGGNNPGKSWWAGSLVMRFLTRKFTWEQMNAGKLQVLMVSQDEDASSMFQQPAVYAHFPREWRLTNESGKKPPGFAKVINYGEKNGFTEGSFVLPRPLKGQCWFKTVAQYTREPKSFEGPAYDLVIIDEGCPLQLFKSLLGRVAKRGGRIVYLLTCLNGYDQTMGQGLDGAKLLRTLPMQWDFTFNAHPHPDPLPQERVGGVNPEIVFPELRLGEHQSDLLKRIGCPAGHMPYMMQPLNPNWGVIFMWNTMNPFQPRGKWNEKMPAMFDACVGAPRWKVLVVIFGWIERVGQLALGNFNPETHVVRGERRTALDTLIKDGKATVYMGDDPETQRSHAVLWLAVFAPNPAWPKGLKYIFDESPRIQEGEWVNGNGERGEGQYVYRATGSNWYKKYFREREREWNVAEVGRSQMRSTPLPAGDQCRERLVLRKGDPRGFATEESTATGTRSLFELYLEDHAAEHPECYPMIFHPAKIRRASTLDLDIIIGLLKYDEDRAVKEGGLSAENTPELLVSERCENFIRCALNYTLTDLGRSDEDNPHRDFIDCLRYVLSSATPYMEPGDTNASSGGGAWG